MELEQFRLHLEWIPGSRNLIADSLSCLIDVVPDAQQPDEPKDHEFGSYCFEKLEPAKVLEEVSTEVTEQQVGGSESSEQSQNLQIPTKVGIFELKYKEKLLRKQHLLYGSKSSKCS